MLKQFRERTAFVAALLALLVATIGAPHSTDPRHDSDRSIVVVPHNEANHQLRAVGTDSNSSDTHCVLCHFVRSFRPRSDTRVVSAPPVHTTAHRPIEVLARDSSERVVQPPLRAPPASPFSA